jgi:hypothetical protein
LPKRAIRETAKQAKRTPLFCEIAKRITRNIVRNHFVKNPISNTPFLWLKSLQQRITVDIFHGHKLCIPSTFSRGNALFTRIKN